MERTYKEILEMILQYVKDNPKEGTNGICHGAVKLWVGSRITDEEFYRFKSWMGVESEIRREKGLPFYNNYSKINQAGAYWFPQGQWRKRKAWLKNKIASL